MKLTTGWRLESSPRVGAAGERVSRPGFDASSWHEARVPNTVVGALVEDGTFPDPYFGMNLRRIPGTSYPIGQRFAPLPTPDDSPFKPAWWYRTELPLPESLRGRRVFLRLDGVNYRAAVWLNGVRVAGPEEVVGAFRRHELEVTELARPGEVNALAVEVFGPGPRDLAITWVDWNPAPPDKNMGLWGPVSLASSGPVCLRHPHVIAALDVPSLASAVLGVSVEAANAADRPRRAVVRGAIEGVRFEREVRLEAGERAVVRFTPAEFPALRMHRPRVWWPHRMGGQDLYTAELEVDVEGRLSDRQVLRFGVRHVASELTDEGHRLFTVNGRRVLVRGGGWASDMLLRPAPPERLLAELRYTREMGLNTIRLEGKLEGDDFYDRADEMGILVMPGWCCGDHWEKWEDWTAEDHAVAAASLRDQVLRLRNHPSVLAWLNGSDFPPPAPVERAYLDVLASLDWTAGVLSSATGAPGALSGPSGVKMKGPYDYVPPAYWLTDTRNGGAFGFATEVGPGAAVPPVESLRAMLPEDQLWPPGEHWAFHAGCDEFKDLRLFTEALEARYGPATDVHDYARKAQALAYEGQRAMFEAYGRNKYAATGVIQWMLNNAWPSMIWHLYDYFLRPGGGYFGARKACEPLHVQYSYDDRSVAVVNDLPRAFHGLRVSARMTDLALATLHEAEAVVDVEADGVVGALRLPTLAAEVGTYLVRLRLCEASGRLRSENVYWLSTRDDVIDWPNARWHYTPTAAHADLTALSRLPGTALRVAAERTDAGPEARAVVQIENVGKDVAFQVRLRLTDGPGGPEVLPAYWEDNYLAVFPGEVCRVAVAYDEVLVRVGRAVVDVLGWNTLRQEAEIEARPR